MKKYLFPAAILFAVACNNSDQSSKTTNDTTTVTDTNKMNHDTMSKMNMSVNVPAVPAVPDGAKVMFKNLKNDQSVTSPVKVEMGVEKMKIDTAGPVVDASGHFHIFIDAEDSYPDGQMIPKDSTHLHFGKGQTSAEVPLTPGKHKLTLQFADGLHRSYGSKMASTVTVNVKK